MTINKVGWKGCLCNNDNIGSMLLQSSGIGKEKVAAGYEERGRAKAENYSP